MYRKEDCKKHNVDLSNNIIGNAWLKEKYHMGRV